MGLFPSFLGELQTNHDSFGKRDIRGYIPWILDSSLFLLSAFDARQSSSWSHTHPMPQPVSGGNSKHSLRQGRDWILQWSHALLNTKTLVHLPLH